MRPKRQIKKRIEIYEAQIEEYENHIKLVNSYSEREYYRNLIRKNLDALDLLKWVIAETVAEAQSKQARAICSCGSPEFYNDKVLGVVCCRCQAPYSQV